MLRKTPISPPVSSWFRPDGSAQRSCGAAIGDDVAGPVDRQARNAVRLRCAELLFPDDRPSCRGRRRRRHRAVIPGAPEAWKQRAHTGSDQRLRTAIIVCRITPHNLPCLSARKITSRVPQSGTQTPWLAMALRCCRCQSARERDGHPQISGLESPCNHHVVDGQDGFAVDRLAGERGVGCPIGHQLGARRARIAIRMHCGRNMGGFVPTLLRC